MNNLFVGGKKIALMAVFLTMSFNVHAYDATKERFSKKKEVIQPFVEFEYKNQEKKEKECLHALAAATVTIFFGLAMKIVFSNRNIQETFDEKNKKNKKEPEYCGSFRFVRKTSFYGKHGIDVQSKKIKFAHRNNQKQR
jgi:hypothetical protein